MKRIAVVGSGIAGMSAAYYLSRHHDVSLFEADQRLGGHTHTVDLDHGGEKSAIDTGFIVFNDRTYPHFQHLLGELGVAYQPTEMSFSVRSDQQNLEYNGHSLATLFAQKRNLLRPKFWALIRDILKFNKAAKAELHSPSAQTLGAFLDKNGFGRWFVDCYLLPMGAAIWSMGLDEMRDFPLQFFARFFENHGLLDVANRPQWFTIEGGSRSYIGPLTAPYRQQIHLATPIHGITRLAQGVRLTSGQQSWDFDEVVLACHADQALAMLSEPSDGEKAVLGALGYSDNDVVLHTDQGHLPKRRRAWASWNYRLGRGRGKAVVTYQMNILQRLAKQHQYLVTLNDEVDESQVLGRYRYSHPVYTLAAIDAQQQWQRISGQGGIHYCGAYWFNGFHEDGVRSALRVCDALGATP
ncbi:NAD(P)/FAD-dependent oxidoreductase [Gallaecimonas xiamenensis]|uniref:Amine oxidase, flavin-containing protein n=1 Tax=Gallaecimonas xiamenensis 3-C-1 TaxID=745411 RepID=K2J1B6_9GAMM|nr:FAD-dependent oxidoreductase [Gallaecimonas xiamenensis]EKE76716.1 amine oxidase, flavin-containing protein [Gallaecimonas xiamenensis 3-C-1]